MRKDIVVEIAATCQLEEAMMGCRFVSPQHDHLSANLTVSQLREASIQSRCRSTIFSVSHPNNRRHLPPDPLHHRCIANDSKQKMTIACQAHAERMMSDSCLSSIDQALKVLQPNSDLFVATLSQSGQANSCC